MKASPPNTHLSCRGLAVRVPGRLLVKDLELVFEAGSITALLGQNGAGKTTLLHTLAGLRPPAGGSISLCDRGLSDWPRRPLARTLGLLMQSHEYPFPATALDTVLTGRHPHIGLLGWVGDADLNAARSALAAVELEDFAARDVMTMSGGERRRLAIATLFAQDPDVLLLDEPINNLDPRHQVTIMRLLRKYAAAGRTVILSLHDVNLAYSFCDQALLLFGDGRWQAGEAGEVINETTLAELYATRFVAAGAAAQQFFFAA